MTKNKWAEYDASRGRPRINIVLDAEEIDMVRELAQGLGESVSALIGQLIREEYETSKGKNEDLTSFLIYMQDANQPGSKSVPKIIVCAYTRAEALKTATDYGELTISAGQRLTAVPKSRAKTSDWNRIVRKTRLDASMLK